MNMVVCNKCGIEKPITEYFKEKKKNGKEYYKKYCLDCFRKQSRDWKAKRKLEKQLLKEIPKPKEIIQPEVLKSQIEVLEGTDGYKKCIVCEEVKEINEFTKSLLGKPYKTCKICTRIRHRKTTELNKNLSGGSERVAYKPNQYYDEYQKAQTFEFLLLCGWKFTDGIWWKEGIKNEDGTFINVKPDKVRKKTKHQTNVRRLTIYENADKIMEYFRNGMPYKEIADIYNCSHTSIRRLIIQQNGIYGSTD